MNKFNMGDVVHLATVRSTEKRTTCPDCMGKKFLTVIMGDDSRVTIDCAGCSLGYDPPRGYVTYFEHEARSETFIVGRIEIKPDGVEYGYGCRCGIKESDVFATAEEAMVRAKELEAQYNAEKLQKVYQKTKLTRTWSRNATYHRKRIRECERDLAHHRAKLDAAKAHVKTKEPKPEEGTG